MPSNAAPATHDPQSWAIYCAVGAVCCLLYLLNAYYTPIPLWPIFGHDDGHFLSQASQIAHGHWLGDYDQMTLIKGPGFPLFLAVGRYSHLPYSVFLALFQACSFAALSVVVGRFAGSPRLALALLIALLTFPWIWTSPLTRVVRDGIYTPQIFIFLALSFLVLWSDVRRHRLVAILAGLTLGWIAITREETPWLYPVIGFVVAVSFFLSWRLKRPMRSLVIGLICIAAGFGAVRTAVSTVNYVKYKGFLVTDINEGNFRRSLAALFAVGAAEQIDHVPTPTASRNAIYQFSPAFAELRPLLEGETAPLSGWQGPGCNSFGGAACHDYSYPWSMWALRDAVAATGHYQNATTAAQFYHSVASEIDAACTAGKLICRYSPLAEMPPPVAGSFQRALGAAWQALKRTAMLEAQAPDRLDSIGPPNVIAVAQGFLNRPLIAPAKERLQDPPAARAVERPMVHATRILQGAIRSFYRIVWPAACVMFVVLLPLATFLAVKRRQLDYALLIAWTFTVVAASRILLLSFVTGYMYDALVLEYLTTAPYALLVATVTTGYSLLDSLRSRNGAYSLSSDVV